MKPTAFETESRSQNTEEESHTHQLLMNREKRIENMKKDLEDVEIEREANDEFTVK